MCREHCTSIACATCPRVYHPQCLSPPLEPFDLPSPWFCPVCIERGWHELELDLTPLSKFAAPADPSIAAPSAFYGHDGHYMSQESCQSVIGPFMEEQSSDAVMQHGAEASAHHDCQVLPVHTITQNAQSDHGGVWQTTPPSRSSSTVVASEVNQATGTPDSKVYASARGRQKSETTSEGISSGLFTFRVDTSIAHPHSRPTMSASAQPANGARCITTRRSRYSTLPSHLDQSIAVLVNELESAVVLRDKIQHLESQVNKLEQELRIQQGRTRLAQQEGHDQLRAENTALRLELRSKQEEVHSVCAQRQHLSEELESLKVVVGERSEDMASLRRIMKSIMHE